MSFNIDTLGTVEKKQKRFSLLEEIRDFVTIFVIIFGFWWLFVNAQLVLILVDNLTWSDVVRANEVILAQPNKQLSIKNIDYSKEKTSKVDDDSFKEIRKKILEKKINEKLNLLHRSYRTDSVYKPKYNDLLKDNSKWYNINFNVLPPDARLSIPKIWVDVHIVTLSNVSIKTIKDADYDKYLYDGVVKYPYTTDPGQKGNVFIFGHTSYYWWKKNPYGTVFSKIPRLRHWDIMKLNWGGKVYSYEIFKKLILSPKQVSSFYKKYKNWEFLTIMGCYPIGSDRQRMVIIAKRVWVEK